MGKIEKSDKNKNTVWHEHQFDKSVRAKQKQQKPCIIWFTGLSGSGKSTLAGALELELFKRGYHSYLLDGDNVRHGLNKDLGFTDADRVENIRRIGEVAKLFVDSGMIVLSAFISPFEVERRLVRGLVNESEFIEVYLDTPLATCESRDPKGLYKKARAGEIKNFTGIDSAYERPESPEVTVDSSRLNVEQGVKVLIDYLEKHQVINF